MKFETSDNLPKYFRSIRKKDPLTKEQELELAKKIQVGDRAALNTLVEHNLKLVVKIANRHIGQGVSLDDLIQEGNIGIFEAALRFSAEQDVRFSVYASLWIRKRINEAVVAHGRIVRLPHNQEYDRYKAKKRGEEVENLRPLNIDDPVADNSDEKISDRYFASSPEIDKEFEKDFFTVRVRQVISILSERDRKVIKMHFGIDTDQALGTSEIAEHFGMTQVRICQIIKASIEKMKEMCHADADV